MIPNIIHFIFGLKKQNEEFLFVYYLAVLSAKIVNNPENIYFYYHYEPYGEFWEKTKKLCNIIKIKLPTHIGNKQIIQTAHKADIVRMEKLYELGGIYLDIDTISVRPYKKLLNYDCVLGKELTKNNKIHGLCNAIMLTKPNSKFFKLWKDQYEDSFQSNGWGESSIKLPYNIYNKNNSLVHVMEPEVFFVPSWFETKKIFRFPCDLNENLISLHLWESNSLRFFKNINSFDWCKGKYKNTLYAKILQYLDINYNFNQYI